MVSVARVVSRFSDLVARFLVVLSAERRYSEYTIRNYRSALDRFGAFLTEHLGGEPDRDALAALKARDFRAYLAKRHRDGLDSASLQLELSGLRSFFRHWDRQGVLPSAAVMGLKSPRRRTILPRPVSADAADALIAEAACPSGATPEWVAARDTALFALLYGAGLRISEALSLPWSTSSGTLRIHGKGGKSRDVPMLAAVEEALAAYRTAYCAARSAGPPDPDDPLFVGVRGRRLSAGVAQARMRKLRERLELPVSATPHALRHAFATELLASGADLRVIQELLGHASLASTQRYTAIDPDRLAVEHRRCHPRARTNSR